MDKAQIYDSITDRKYKPTDHEPYVGGNGRVDKCVQLFRSGKLRTGGALLDVGGAIGDLGYAVRDLFETRFVLDISSRFTDAAFSKGNVTITADVDREGLKLADGTVDVVTALDFIEHIVDPENFARECYRVLKPSGEVFVNTPNIRFWRHIQELWHQGTFPHTSGDREVFHGGHLAFYTYQDLRLIFEPAGFTSVEQIKDEEGYQQPPPWVLSALQPKNQQEYTRLCLEFGCPNLLYKAVCVK